MSRDPEMKQVQSDAFWEGFITTRLSFALH